MGINCGDKTCLDTPVKVENLNIDFVEKLQCGSFHTMVLDSKGKLYIWGHTQLVQGNCKTPIQLDFNDPIDDCACRSYCSVIQTHKGIYVWGYVSKDNHLKYPEKQLIGSIDEAYLAIRDETCRPFVVHAVRDSKLWEIAKKEQLIDVFFVIGDYWVY